MDEIWKDIPHYEGLYQVSNYGRVKSLEREVDYINRYGGISTNHYKEKIIAQAVRKDGYQQVRLSKHNKGKMELVHRLVAMAFIPNPNNLPQVNHIDEDKANNVVENLEWCDAKYNMNYGTKIDKQVNTTKENCKKSTQIIKCDMEGNELEYYLSMREAERLNNLANNSISAYFRKGYKHCGGFTWKKLED